jgi:DNA-binding response OmpR family regulator
VSRGRDDRLRLASVLIVGGDAELRETLRELLEGEGYRTATARDGSEAREMLVRGPGPYLVLLDLPSPCVESARLREILGARHETVVVAMSSLRAEERVLDDTVILQKPFDLEEFLRVVARNVLRVRA